MSELPNKTSSYKRFLTSGPRAIEGKYRIGTGTCKMREMSLISLAPRIQYARIKSGTTREHLQMTFHDFHGFRWKGVFVEQKYTNRKNSRATRSLCHIRPFIEI